jgi:hypothetical protein
VGFDVERQQSYYAFKELLLRRSSAMHKALNAGVPEGIASRSRCRCTMKYRICALSIVSRAFACHPLYGNLAMSGDTQ